MKNKIVMKAIEVAKAAHAGQTRKYTGEPYWTHPVAVAEAVEALGAPPAVVAAAVLHDVVEDTPYGLEKVKATFGPIVAALVAEVTSVTGTSPEPRAARKVKDLWHYAGASYWGQTIKLSDIAHNVANVATLDPGFAKVYLPEQEALAAALTNAHPAAKANAAAALKKAKGELTK